jgi:hypothetical protein
MKSRNDGPPILASASGRFTPAAFRPVTPKGDPVAAKNFI